MSTAAKPWLDSDRPVLALVTVKPLADARKGTSRAPLDRMREIARLIMAGDRVNCSLLAEQFEVVTLTIFRDVEFMRDRLGYELEFDHASLSYVGRAPKERVL